MKAFTTIEKSMAWVQDNNKVWERFVKTFYFCTLINELIRPTVLIDSSTALVEFQVFYAKNDCFTIEKPLLEVTNRVADCGVEVAASMYYQELAEMIDRQHEEENVYEYQQWCGCDPEGEYPTGNLYRQLLPEFYWEAEPGDDTDVPY